MKDPGDVPIPQSTSLKSDFWLHLANSDVMFLTDSNQMQRKMWIGVLLVGSFGNFSIGAFSW